jgi:hypothetical protein
MATLKIANKKTKSKLEEITYLAWEESDSWNGPSYIGCSLHKSIDKYDAYMNIFSKGQQKAYRLSGGKVPECYSRPAGKPVPAYASQNLYKRICKAGNGFMIFDTEEKKLVKEKELVYGKLRGTEPEPPIPLCELLAKTQNYLREMIIDLEKKLKKN